MTEIGIIIGLVISAYLLGSIPFGYLIAKKKGIPDIRETGSGSTGGTNVSRKLGIKWGIVVALFDALKCALPVFLARKIFNIDLTVSLIMIISAVLGHIYPIWLKFRAGKGVASAIGGLLVIIPPIGLLFPLGIWLSLLVSTGYVSLANLSLLLSLAIVLGFAYQSLLFFLLGILLVIIITWAHRENIAGIIKGTERKFDLPKFKKP